MDIRLKDGWLTFVVLICVVMLIAVQGVPEAESAAKGCVDGVCPLTCCRSTPGFDACCCLSPTHRCKCPPKPIDPGLWDRMTKDFGG